MHWICSFFFFSCLNTHFHDRYIEAPWCYVLLGWPFFIFLFLNSGVINSTIKAVFHNLLSLFCLYIDQGSVYNTYLVLTTISLQIIHYVAFKSTTGTCIP